MALEREARERRSLFLSPLSLSLSLSLYTHTHTHTHNTQDDVAGSDENPYPGKLFNKPTEKGDAGVDVYDGCKVDYKGSVVTAQLFLDVLTGNKDAVAGKSADGSDKVLMSTSNDRVFVNFVDHGGAGIVAFPNGPYLQAEDLVDTLKKMSSNKKYNQLVFYMEACESGSMFENLLPNDLNIFVTTASNAEESSWGTYCPPQDSVNGKSIGACLGDLYSVNWMEDSDTKAGLARTLDQQYDVVKKETNKSHVQEFGSVGTSTHKYHIQPHNRLHQPTHKQNTGTFDASEPVSDFQAHTSSFNGLHLNKESSVASSSAAGVTNSRDIPLVTAFYKYLRNPEASTLKGLLNNIETREKADKLFPSLVNTVKSQSNLLSESKSHDEYFTCKKAVYALIESSCGGFDDYSLKYSHDIISLCEDRNTADVLSTIKSAC